MKNLTQHNTKYIDLNYKNMSITVKKSYHATERMTQRQINDSQVSSAIIYVADYLNRCIDNDIMICDHINNISFVVGVAEDRRYNKDYFITIITVIDDAKVFTKSHTIKLDITATNQ